MAKALVKQRIVNEHFSRENGKSLNITAEEPACSDPRLLSERLLSHKIGLRLNSLPDHTFSIARLSIRSRPDRMFPSISISTNFGESKLTDLCLVGLYNPDHVVRM